jgi:NDP-sugar pyrophosphorylase family protein
VIDPIRHALVLAAGLGTRLRPLTDVRAKPAIPVAGEPMVRRIIAWLATHGVTDLILNLHHRPETLTAIVGDGADLSVHVRYSWEPQILGSAGGPKLALPLVSADPFLIVNGDTITDVDPAGLIEAHATSGALVTLALVPNREFERYGGVLLDADGCVTGFVRRGPSAEGSYHFIGVQVVQAAAFDSVPQGEAARSIGGVYDTLMHRHPGSVRGFVSDAEFWDVGTVDDYWRTSTAFAKRSDMADLGVGRGSRIAPSARITRSILWDDVQVGADAVIDDCILTDGVRVADGTSHHGEILIRT